MRNITHVCKGNLLLHMTNDKKNEILELKIWAQEIFMLFIIEVIINMTDNDEIASQKIFT